MKTPRFAAALRRLATGAFLSAVLGATAYSARAETLVIGMTQFPSNFHPAIEAMLAKTMVLSAIRRPFVTHDQDWQPRCMLCTTFPTLENGLAQRETLEGGGEGLADLSVDALACRTMLCPTGLRVVAGCATDGPVPTESWIEVEAFAKLDLLGSRGIVGRNWNRK